MVERIIRLTSLILILSLLLAVQTIQSTSNYNMGYILESMGIHGPFISYSIDHAKYKYSVEIENLELMINKSWTMIRVDDNYKHVIEPGYPMLPVKTYKIVVDGYIDEDDVKVWVRVKDFKILTIDKPILPAPKPLTYTAYTSNKLIYEPDSGIYSRDEYYPGRVIDLRVYHGLHGRSIIILVYYPIHYNPVRSEIVVISKAEIYIDYNRPYTIHVAGYGLLIITKNDLVDVVKPLKKFYESKGFRVSIVTTEYIYNSTEPAENITDYPGFYNHEQAFFDFIYDELQYKYNWTLALKIINYIRSVKYNYTHVLLIGNALDVPPSFYYLGDDIGDYDAWIPTDLFYASPDYDLIPDLYVGRIPFSDPDDVSKVINKILSWYNTTIPHSRKLYMSGGYPFRQVLMFGETALSTYVKHRSTTMFNTTLLTRTSGNYNKTTIGRIFRGEEGVLWYYALAHGDGESLGDYIVTGEWASYEVLMSKDELLSMPHNPAVPVISSVACINAAWDTDLVEPYYFTPPSFGEAVLLSPAGGIAYIGSSRVAYEYGLSFTVEQGRLTASYYGAALLHEDIIKAYNSFMGKRSYVTLGHIVAEGISEYLSDAATYLRGAIGEIMKLTLLGDPALILPVYPGAYTSKVIDSITPLNAEDYFDVSRLSYYANGKMPLYKLFEDAVLEIKGGDGIYKITLIRLYRSYKYIEAYDKLYNDTINVLWEGVKYSIRFNKSINGLLLIKISAPGWGEYRFILGAAGLYITPNTTTAGSNIHVEGYGLDLLGYDYINIYVAGRLISQHVPIKDGTIEWDLALPYLAPGNYTIVIIPGFTIYYEFFLDPSYMITHNITVYATGRLTIITDNPVISERSGRILLRTLVLYNGRPLDANISVKATLNGEDVKSTIERISTGEYIISISAYTTGICRVYINTSYINETLRAYGSTIVSFTLVDKIYRIGETLIWMNNSLKLILTHAVRQTDALIDIEDKIGSLRYVVDDMKDTLNKNYETTELINAIIKERFDETEGKVEMITSYVLIVIALTGITMIASMLSLMSRH